MESSHPYIKTSNEARTYIRPGASSITLTFSNKTRVRDKITDLIIIYYGNEKEIQYTRTDLQGKTIEVPGDTVQVRLIAIGKDIQMDDPTACYGFKVDNITVTYPTDGVGSVLSQGSIWIIAAVAAVAVAGAAALVIVKKKKKPALAGGENTDE